MNDSTIKNILEFWKLEEYYTPYDFPPIKEYIKEENKPCAFDCYYDEYSKTSLPLENYKRHDEFLRKKNAENPYAQAKLYCGGYKISSFIRNFVDKYAKSNADIRRENINRLTGNFCIFSIGIDFNGTIIKKSFSISPFFYAVAYIIKTGNLQISADELDLLNSSVNEAVYNRIKISRFEDIEKIKNTLYNIMKIQSEEEFGLERTYGHQYACKALKGDDSEKELSSFFLKDIERVQNNYRENPQLTKYICALLNHEPSKTQIDTDIESMKYWLDPSRFPMAKYPSKHSPSLMQQIAINIAISENEENTNIFSVNGPPGTGKTTLLKEIIANNVEKQAEAIVKFIAEGTGFTEVELNPASTSGHKECYYKIPNEIAKYGILITSSNNKAVENLSLQLPLADEMSEDKTLTSLFSREQNSEVYFTNVAEALLHKDKSSGTQNAWGLVSARMGKMSYESDVLDCCIFSKKNDKNEKITLDRCGDKIPLDKAIEEFNAAKREVEALRTGITGDLENYSELTVIQDKLKDEEDAMHALKGIIESYDNNNKSIQGELFKIKNELGKQENEINIIKKSATFPQKILLFFGIGNISQKIIKKTQETEELRQTYEEKEKKAHSLRQSISEYSSQWTEHFSSINNLKRRKVLLKQNIENLKDKYGANLADQDFYEEISEQKNQIACPWTFSEYDMAREKLFYASLQLKKAFILNQEYIQTNLSVYESYCKGCYKAQERSEMFPHLLNALSVVIPVISSTFASIERFLKHAGNMSLGTLIIDEAGQAVPQAALGAIYRTKKVIAVGDPLQIEPVVSIPDEIINILCKTAECDEGYSSPTISVQELADLANVYIGKIDCRQVGCPLRVHRRCIAPMFSISNEISYGDSMYNETTLPDAQKKFLLSESVWFDVKGTELGNKNHYVKNQGEAVIDLLMQASCFIESYKNLFETEDKLFIITPFKSVAIELKNLIKNHYGYCKSIDSWAENCVGTIHTFQGKEADEVIFVLGCDKNSKGATDWVVEKANIINVACTRAKYRIAIIGDYDIWKSKKYFREIIKKIKIEEWSKSVFKRMNIPVPVPLLSGDRKPIGQL